MADGLVVADTDLIIDFLRGRGPAAEWVRHRLGEGRLRLTAITAFELRVGTDFLRRQQIGALLALRTLPLDTPGALRAGEIFARLREEGTAIGIKDSFQAGICLRFSQPLASRNVRQFSRVPGLRLEAVGSA